MWYIMCVEFDDSILSLSVIQWKHQNIEIEKRYERWVHFLKDDLFMFI